MHRARARRALRRLLFQAFHGPSSYGLGLACLALASAGIVLAHAPPPAPALRPAARPTTPPRPVGSTIFRHGPLTITGALSQSVVRVAPGDPIALELTVAARRDTEGQRPPIAMAIVLDGSGSMSGEKLEQARRAVADTVNRMRDKDHLALVSYDTSARVVLPLGPIGGRRNVIRRAIASLEAGGGTQIPNGLALGYRTLESASRDHVRRMVLVSDGIDGSGIGPHGASELVRGYANEGVTTAALGIGLDYEERYLTAVADGGRGAYAFLSTGAELGPFLGAEIDRAGATVAEQVALELALPEGVMLTRVHGAEVEHGGGLRLPLGPMAAGEQRRVTVELTTHATTTGPLDALGLGVRYRDRALQSLARARGGALTLVASASETEVLASRNPEVFVRTEAVRLEAAQRDAIALWRTGDAPGAVSLARRNAATLQRLRRVDDSPALANLQAEVERDAASFESISAASARGRSYGLRSNDRRRRRVATGVWQ